MGYVYTGYKRSLSITVTKTINGVASAGYPKTYPTATDIANGYFTYSGTNYAIPPNGMTEEEFAQLDTTTYNSLLAAFQLYVLSLEPGLNFTTHALNSPTVYDSAACPPGPVATTTTTTGTTTTSTTGTTTTTAAPVAGFALYIVGGNYIAKSTDNGQSWTSKYTAASILHSISFLDENIGFATGVGDAGGNGCIYKTTDAGEHWTDDVLQLPAVAANKTIFSSTKELSDYLYVGGNMSTFMLYDRAAGTWSDVSKGTSHNAYDLYAFADDTVLSLTSLSASDNYMLRTTDSGDNWSEPETAPKDKTLTGIDFYGTRGLAVGSRNATTYKMYESADSGVSWVDVSSRCDTAVGTNSMQDISFASADVVFIVGCNQAATQGYLWKSTDGGLSWSDITANFTATPPKLNCVKFYDENNGWAGANNGDVYYTTNGGTTWTAVDGAVSNNGITGIMLIEDDVATTTSTTPQATTTSTTPTGTTTTTTPAGTTTTTTPTP